MDKQREIEKATEDVRSAVTKLWERLADLDALTPEELEFVESDRCPRPIGDFIVSRHDGSLLASVLDNAKLVETAEVAEIIGLGNKNGVSVYRRRYADFPEPFIEKGSCVLWRRQDVDAWAAARRRSDQP